MSNDTSTSSIFALALFFAQIIVMEFYFESIRHMKTDINGCTRIQMHVKMFAIRRGNFCVALIARTRNGYHQD
jgi:hypothetical protein